jgi:hypothetical protein
MTLPITTAPILAGSSFERFSTTLIATVPKSAAAGTDFKFSS